MIRANDYSAFGIRKSAFISVLCALLFAAAMPGCSSVQVQVIHSDGSARWSGLGVQVTLPEGTWRVRSSEKDQAATFFPEGRRGTLALFRVKIAPHAPDGLAFARLFASFPDKKKISSSRIVLREGRSSAPADGLTAECAEYEVKTRDGATRVKAYALRHGDWTYEIAEWGFDGESPPGERLLAGLEFAE